MTTLQFTVLGPPVPKGRPRSRLVKNKGSGPDFISVYTPDKTAHYENCVRDEAAKLGSYFGPLIPLLVVMTFYVERPKSLPRKIKSPVKKPDIENYMKSVLDALEGIIYYNDAQVVRVVADKFYGSPPRTEIEVRDIEVG